MHITNTVLWYTSVSSIQYTMWEIANWCIPEPTYRYTDSLISKHISIAQNHIGMRTSMHIYTMCKLPIQLINTMRQRLTVAILHDISTVSHILTWNCYNLMWHFTDIINGPVNKLILAQIMAWWLTGDMPLSRPLKAYFVDMCILHSACVSLCYIVVSWFINIIY